MYFGKLVHLRALEMDDLDVLMKYINNIETRRYLGSLLPNSKLAEERWLETAVAADPWRDGKIVLAIEDKNTHEFLGTISLFDISRQHRHAELGISIWNPDGRNKGYGTDAVMTMLWVGFHILDLNNIYLYAIAHNARALRTYEKAGFKRVGIFRKHMYSMGKFQDEVAMDILRNEFMERYPSGTSVPDL